VGVRCSKPSWYGERRTRCWTSTASTGSTKMVREVLRAGYGTSGNRTRSVLPDAAGRVLRRPGFVTGHRLAMRRLVESARVPGSRTDRLGTGPFDGIADTAADRSGGAFRGVLLDARRVGR
jgi:hypothetical protein